MVDQTRYKGGEVIEEHVSLQVLVTKRGILAMVAMLHWFDFSRPGVTLCFLALPAGTRTDEVMALHVLCKAALVGRVIGALGAVNHVQVILISLCK